MKVESKKERAEKAVTCEEQNWQERESVWSVGDNEKDRAAREHKVGTILGKDLRATTTGDHVLGNGLSSKGDLLAAELEEPDSERLEF
ncbi:hypothetical protein JHK85_007531 [Glycine max]|nr:hypothetical protein JHK85_007531 [Glycine max]